MKLKIWQVDAFASKPLEGNPAAIVSLERWLEADLMQRIAAENNVAETAFFVKTGAGAYDLRWFAPSLEVDLCGHATLASAWILFNKTDTALDKVRFMTRSDFGCHESIEMWHSGHAVTMTSAPCCWASTNKPPA